MRNIDFPDRNLRLALLDEVQLERTGQYYWLESVEEDYTAYQVSAGGPEWEEIARRLSTGREELPELEKFLLTLPLTADDLAATQELTLDGDRAVYQLVPEWWNQGGHFKITDLTGIDNCAALERLDLGQGMFTACSLAPLAGLPRLNRLTMCAADLHRDLNVLPMLPALTSLEVANVAHAQGQRDEWHAVLDALRARGVSVETL